MDSLLRLSYLIWGPAIRPISDSSPGVRAMTRAPLSASMRMLCSPVAFGLSRNDIHARRTHDAQHVNDGLQRRKGSNNI